MWVDPPPPEGADSALEPLASLQEEERPSVAVVAHQVLDVTRQQVPEAAKLLARLVARVIAQTVRTGAMLIDLRMEMRRVKALLVTRTRNRSHARNAGKFFLRLMESSKTGFLK